MEQLSITVIQSHLVWENPEANRTHFEQKILSISTPTHIVVLPEMFTTGFATQSFHLAEKMEGATIQWMKKIAAAKKIILAGSIMIKENDQYLNRFIWMQPNGIGGHYDKRHLFSLENEHSHFTPGNKRCIARVGGWRIQLQICYDLRFPVWARQQPPEGEDYEYDVLINCANWPASRNEVWKTLLKARAIENQVYVVGVNRVGKDGNQINHTGNSMIIDPLGNVMADIANEEKTTTITLSKTQLLEYRQQFPFGKDKDRFFLI